MSETLSKHLAIGDEPIPGYRLVHFLGKGGAGQVWEAEAPGGVAKAIKITLVDNTDDLLTRRELEGLQTIRSIRHPFLLALDRFEVVDGYLVIVMELADKSLFDRLRECLQAGLSGIPRPELLGYLAEAAEVLDKLNHEHGLQHLDVKPTNILISSGHVKVADFGLIQPTAASLSESALAFSPGYAPPELFDGRVEPSADQYGLAVTYLELMTGHRPYSATSAVDLICQMNEQDPDLSGLWGSDRIILKRALNRDVRQRFRTCTALIEALQDPEEFVKTLPRLQGSVLLSRTPVPDESENGGKRTPSAEEGPPPTIVRTMAFRPPTPPKPVSTVAMAPQPASQQVFADRFQGASTKDVDVEPQIVAQDHVRATFLASLPLEIYALKLRGFLDAFGGEIVTCTERKTIVRIRERGFLGFKKWSAVYIKIETFASDPASDVRVVDAVVWSTIRHLHGERLAYGGMLLIRCLKAYLMANEHKSATFNPVAIRQQLLAKK